MELEKEKEKQEILSKYAEMVNMLKLTKEQQNLNQHSIDDKENLHENKKIESNKPQQKSSSESSDTNSLALEEINKLRQEIMSLSMSIRDIKLNNISPQSQSIDPPKVNSTPGTVKNPQIARNRGLKAMIKAVDISTSQSPNRLSSSDSDSPPPQKVIRKPHKSEILGHKTSKNNIKKKAEKIENLEDSRGKFDRLTKQVF